MLPGLHWRSLSIARSHSELPVTALVSVAIATFVAWVVMMLTAGSTGKKHPGLAHDLSNRFMGLIVLAMGVQFALAGLQKFFQLG